MKKELKTGAYTAKYDETTLIWCVYMGNISVAIINDDSREIIFTNTEVAHHISELNQLRDADGINYWLEAPKWENKDLSKQINEIHIPAVTKRIIEIITPIK